MHCHATGIQPDVCYSVNLGTREPLATRNAMPSTKPARAAGMVPYTPR
jgi:hypothetical protein